ncbi:Surface presentation of antigens protein spaS [Serratia fonticola]|uniref:Flagellar biosynthetic protein FlhB n=1 Tax=Serratia fonticola TaxID=47917 RepID=A0A4U9UTJ5_SERFO|nr:Surface presentation of antigens protein spaS [Serratia fonticola]
MVFWEGIKIFLPFLMMCIFSSMFPTLLQTGFLIATKALKINFDSLNPTQGIKKIFSLRALKDAVKACLYLICFVVAVLFSGKKNRLLLLSQMHGRRSRYFLYGGSCFIL